MKKYLILFMAVFLLAACSNEQEVYDFPDVVIDEDEQVTDDQVALTINGTDISGKVYNDTYLQVKTINERQEDGATLSKEDLKERTIETLVHNELFLQLAEEKGIDVAEHYSEDDVKELKKLDDEGYRELVEKFNYTDEQISKQIQLEKVRKQYIDQYVEVEVSEAEMEELYEEVKDKSDNELPDYESSKDYLRDQIEINKSIDIVGEHIEAFEDESTIEIHI